MDQDQISTGASIPGSRRGSITGIESCNLGTENLDFSADFRRNRLHFVKTLLNYSIFNTAITFFKYIKYILMFDR